MVIVLVSTGLVTAPPTHANDAAVTPVTTTAAADAVGDSDPLPLLAFLILYQNLYSCYEMSARLFGDRLVLNGRSVFFNNQALVQAAIGFAILSGANLVWGIEGFPNPLLPVAAKIGGLIALATLTGNGYGFHFVVPQNIAFQFQTRLAAGPCPAQFADQ